ncbi:hypothetical protein B566_EDAN012228 [Ephemera danica]|nr:hypothetical protein B566_EDAN012228 [Ephemera danica]
MVERDFDLVMISDYMEVSLVLFADLMCWPLEDVTFLRLNSRKNRTQLVEKDLDQLRELNKADTLLYRHFMSAFRKRVQSYGMEKMESQLLRLITLNLRLQRECPTTNTSGKNNDPFGFCKFYTMPELKFTDLIRDQQKYKISVLHNFTLLNENK